MRERLFMGVALSAGIGIVFLIGGILKGVMYIVQHLHIVWQ